MPHPCYSSEEIIRCGEELYTEGIRDQVESEHRGEFLVIDIETAQYEIDSDQLRALDRAKAKRPDAPLYILRIGFPAVARLGTCIRVETS